ncbi:hypothetical protein GLAREA_06340 [Glarea lozoyensis ATCC 20868]|uniref:Uncharacterized protein n=1 Tax=Glarea lozoyensis (strain ATCC 20868 / MF5171) TaxID=1116229 RepID=S3E4K6_GLAL2|nr:uncharacterized protein GLAREA_06340 [Glarea lozoyensis ATCC 20868]EPE33328.1 hypothetical protein GLAREA_06340 [Glarea lozoyensis ATCC 20868]
MSVSAGDVIRIAGLAWEIYRLGWGEEFDASQQYQEFGSDIKSLAENLNNIARVVENARATWAQESLRFARSRGPLQQRDWDLSSLNEIIGDYQKTLIECRKLLEENYEFRKSRNFAYNFEWNLVIQPKVDGLRRRLESHNAKIAILLKPLELNLLSEIHRDLADRIDAVHRSILHLQGLLIPDVEQALYEQARSTGAIVLVVPLEIERKFQLSAERIHPEMRFPGQFPLKAGADAFIAHFRESTRNFTAGNFLNERTPLPKQYLALLKCIWIIRSLLQSSRIREVPQDSQWPGYIRQLNEDVSVESQRFTAPSAQRLIAPNLNVLVQDDEYSIWPAENIAEHISPHSEVFLEEVMKIQLPAPSQSLQREMTVYRLEQSKFRLVESIEERGNQGARRQEFKMDIDLKTVNLTPLYATPSSRQKSLEVLINSPSTQIQPTFQDIKQTLRFQHLLTGYKVYERYDQAMVTVSFFVSDQKAPIVEHGRLQLWLPQPYGSGTSSSTTSVAPSTAQTPANMSQTTLNTAMGSMSLGNRPGDRSPLSPQAPSRGPSPFERRPNDTGRGPSPFDRRPSDTSSRSATPSQENVGSSRYSIRSFSTRNRNRTPSVMTSMTNSSSMSRSTVSSITTVSTGTGKAHLHHKPSKPLLVIFLKSQDSSAKLALAAIQIDDKTEVKRERCQCRTSNSKCRISCIERSDGFLHAQRWDADQGLMSWNLAQVGTEQRKDLPANAWNNVKRVSMSFDCLEDRYKFSGSPCSCKPKMAHDQARCILEGHHGIFGVVKQIGSQRLKNYHDQRDQSTSRNMVLGSLPEDEQDNIPTGSNYR